MWLLQHKTEAFMFCCYCTNHSLQAPYAILPKSNFDFPLPQNTGCLLEVHRLWCYINFIQCPHLVLNKFKPSLLLTNVFPIIKDFHTPLSTYEPRPLTYFDEVAELNMYIEGGKGWKALHLGSHPIYSARNNYRNPSCASIIFFLFN